MAEETSAAPSGDSGSKSNKIVMIASIVNTVGMLAVVALTLIAFQKQKSQVSVEDIAVTEGGGHGEAGGHGDAGGHGGGGHGGGGHGEAGGHGGGGHGGPAAKTGGVPTDTGKIVPLEGFQINLAVAPGSQPRYLKMNMSFELQHGQDEEEIKTKTAKIRDAVINILNSKKAADISSPEGRDLLKEQVRHAANGNLQDTKVKNVYFSNFVISQ